MNRVGEDNGCSAQNLTDRLESDKSSSKSDTQAFDKFREVQFLNGSVRRQSPFNSELPPVLPKKVEPRTEESVQKEETKPETKTPDTFEQVTLPDNGKVIVVSETIVVDGGVFDGKGATFTASSKLGDGGQSESQSPIFILKNGATLKNVTIGDNGADGIHVYNGANLMNVNWKDVGEDALTVKSAGDVFIDGGSAFGAADKIFQINADTNFHLSNFHADDFSTLIRTNGGQQITANVIIDGGSFSNGVNLFRTDSSLASVQFVGDSTTDNVTNQIRVGDEVIRA